MASYSDSFDDETDWGEHSILHDAFDQTTPLAPSIQEQFQQEPTSPSSSRQSIYFDMPPQLHPACSAGFHRVSSCYFSLASSNDNQSVTDILSQPGNRNHKALSSDEIKSEIEEKEIDPIHNSVDLFYHDVLMQVFTFLDLNSLQCFSEVARKPNFEVFYFLQLQLQQSLLLNENGRSCDIDVVNRIPERKENYSASILSRLARSDMGKARELVDEYQASNSTLKTMPLSYSLAYVRHYLQRNGFHKMFSSNSNRDDSNDCKGDVELQSSKIATSQTLASAAIFVTVVGAASLVSSTDASITILTDRFGSDLPNVLFRLGFVGSLMRAISDTEPGTTMREKAESLARSMPAALMPTRRNNEKQLEPNSQEVSAHSAPPAFGREETVQNVNQESQPTSQFQQRTNFALPSLYEMRHMLQQMMSSNISANKNETRQRLLFDPYGHLPSQNDLNDTNNDEDNEEEKKGCDEDDKQPAATQQTNPTGITINSTVDRKVPSGCVGAYSRAIHRAANYVSKQVISKRKAVFDNLSPEEQRERALEFLSHCSSNDTLDQVKEMIAVIDVDRFYVRNDGLETCALHTAAFHGADKVVEFLCARIDLQDSRLDGGLCDVNAKDDNGWTAVHFAAGANSVAAIRVLARHGAILNVEAQNGYTPLSWAFRLSNDELAKELKELINAHGADQSGRWMYSKPLTSIANRFFSLMPSQ